MAANNMNNVHISSDVLSTLVILQQDNLYKLQQQILHGISRSNYLAVLSKNVALKTTMNSQENTCVRASFLIKLQALTRTQVFCCEFCEIFKNTCVEEHL